MDFVAHVKDQHRQHRKSWLIIGKGPSFEAIADLPDDQLPDVTFGLNHVAGEVHLDYWHVFDIDVFDAYSPSILDKVKYLVIPDVLNEQYQLPGYPHVQHRPITRPLGELIASNPILALFSKQQRLLTYPRGPRVKVNYYRNPEEISKAVVTGSYSASTAVSLLASAGIQSLLIVGIDGGNKYAESFSALTESTLLDSGNTSFDVQFTEIAYFRFLHQISVRDFQNPQPLKVYVGVEKEQRLAFEVLKHSIEKHSSVDVDVRDLSIEIQRHIPEFASLSESLTSGTPFSFQRFAIPELMNFSGVGAYIDSDMQVFGDIRQLIAYAARGDKPVNAVAVDPQWRRSPQLSVLVIDAAKCNWDFRDIIADIKAKRVRYQDVFSDDELMQIERGIPPRWNSLEHFCRSETCLLHFTDMRSQPWIAPESPLASLWCGELIETIKDCPESALTLENSIAKGWVRPGLRTQIESGIVAPAGMGIRQYFGDYFLFRPPHLEHSIKQLQSRSTGRVMAQYLGKNIAYRLMKLLVRVAFWLKLKKLTTLFVGAVVATKTTLLSKL